MMIRIVATSLVVTALIASTGWSLDSPTTEVYGSPGRCAICGKPGPCQQKICQIQCGIEKVKKSYWCVESENMCTMLPRRPCANDSCDCESCQAFEPGTACECGTCEACNPSRSKGLISHWFENLTERPLPIVPPQPGKTRAVKKLVKKEYVVERPVYKPVVQYVCAECLGLKSCGVCDVTSEASSPSPSDHNSSSMAEPAPQPVPLPGAQAQSLAPLPPLE
jgi:hypothetical protein